MFLFLFLRSLFRRPPAIGEVAIFSRFLRDTTGADDIGLGGAAGLGGGGVVTGLGGGVGVLAGAGALGPTPISTRVKYIRPTGISNGR